MRPCVWLWLAVVAGLGAAMPRRLGFNRRDDIGDQRYRDFQEGFGLRLNGFGRNTFNLGQPNGVRSTSKTTNNEAAKSTVEITNPVSQNEHFGLYYSFLDPHLANRSFTWQEGEVVCGFHGMRLVSLDNPKKNLRVSLMMAIFKVDGVWASGARSHFDFHWGHGEPVSYGYTAWSRTGTKGFGQPDNAGGNEHCLAVLNNPFNDGIAWHDVACHQKMAFVCEPTGF